MTTTALRCGRAILIATGSELQLALAARARLRDEGIAVRVVSMPCTSLFDRQPADYRRTVLNGLPVLAIEAGVSEGWHKYTGFDGDSVSIDRFGASGAPDLLYREYGITVDAIVAAVRAGA